MIRTAAPSLRIAAAPALVVPAALRSRLLGGSGVTVLGAALASRPEPVREQPPISTLAAELDAIDPE